jgi:tRNA(Ile)-lysidine synthase
LRHRVLHAALRAAGCPGTDLTRGHVLAVDALITDWHGQRGLDLPGGVSARRHCGRLVLSQRQPATDPLTGSAKPQE